MKEIYTFDYNNSKVKIRNSRDGIKKRQEVFDFCMFNQFPMIKIDTYNDTYGIRKVWCDTDTIFDNIRKFPKTRIISAYDELSAVFEDGVKKEHFRKNCSCSGDLFLCINGIKKEYANYYAEKLFDIVYRNYNLKFR